MKNSIKKTLLTIIGTALMALAINGFYSSAGITVGGASGLSLLIYNIFGIETSKTVMVINVLVLVIGYIVVGKTFVANTIIGSLAYPFLLKIVELIEIPVLPIPYNIIIGALIMGLGCSIVMLAGGSSGGSDALGIILNTRYQIPAIRVMTVFDGSVMLLSLSYLNIYTILLSVMAMLIQMLVIKTITLADKTELLHKLSFQSISSLH